ncbi:unnamed protein product [marine sediment metagenome]|uniref:GAF domain-containing protein n=1 Tax=marine sediment metagenome TaxID=412755 RepID=X1JI33_9ZZZZ
MKDEKITKFQLTNELSKLRLRIAELEKSEAEHKCAQEKFSDASARLQMLQQITAVVHSTLDIEKVFRQITDGFVHSMGYTTAIIMGLDNEGKCFEVKAFSTKKRLSSQIDKKFFLHCNRRIRRIVTAKAQNNSR